MSKGSRPVGAEFGPEDANVSHTSAELRSIAFYLPQYHPIPENDEWWEPGFTEWHNVTRARARFKGHYQPHLPQDLGFYDLRLAETRERQAAMARRYGVAGFCYYHYWFNGRRLLERPFDNVLRSGEPDFPFMLCWANENWTRRWDGAEKEVLLAQDYNEADDLAHIRHLARSFADPRYIRHQGKPVFLVYHAAALPDPRRTLDTWRSEYSRLGLGELFIGRVESHWVDRGDPRPLGFDVGVEFQPDITIFPPRINPAKPVRALRRLLRPNSGYRHNHVYSYPQLVENALAKPDPGYPRIPCVTPSWDNSARRRVGATIFKDASPERFRRWTEEVARQAISPTANPRGLMMVNAWNEWAEGNHLEPDQRFGRAYLDAHQQAMAQVAASQDSNLHVPNSASEVVLTQALTAAEGRA